jgi:hypothetical protein
MKRIVLLFTLIILACNFAFALEQYNLPINTNKLIIPDDKSPTQPKPLASTGKNIIIFDNLDRDLPVSNYFELAYTDALKIYPTADPYLNHTVQVSFSDQTFAQYNITDFDVAIFPLGEFALNTTTPGGIKVIDKILEMLNADKNVMIIGRRIITDAFLIPENNDPVVTEFLTSDLGIKKDSSGCMIFLDNSNTYIPFRVKGVPIDSYFLSWMLYCNIGWSRSTGIPPDLPIRSEELVDFVILPQNNLKSKGFDYIDQIGHVGDTVQTTISPYYWVGLRADSVLGKGGRLIMWTLAPNVAALNEMPYFATRIQFTMDWLLLNMPKLKPYLKFETTTLTFPDAPLDYGVKKTIKLQNFSKEKLTIYQTAISDFGDTVFTITKGNITNETLDPMEVRTLEIEFKPTEEREFVGFLDVNSNASNGDVLTVQLQGRGGKNVSPEPDIVVQAEPYDYGTINVGGAPVIDIKISNSGLQDLVIDSLYFDSNTENAFQFAQMMQTPIVIKGGAEYSFSVKFVPTNWGKNYLAKIKVVSNSKKHPVVYISLQGSTPGAPEGPQIQALVDTADFGSVKLNGTSREYVGVKNPGSETLKINNIYINPDKNPDDAFAIDTTFNFPIYVEPNDSIKFPVKFTPLTPGAVYVVPLGIFSNALNSGSYYIYMKGVSDTGTSVRETVSNLSNTLNMKLTPVPVNYSSIITIDAQKFISNATIELYNLIGNKVMSIYEGELSIGTNKFTLTTSNLPAGQYFILLTTNFDKLILPFIIVK